jgi:2-polyprenyl-6-methoxyphenol hydroxylase-like FAD-dependent oxidoreductase
MVRSSRTAVFSRLSDPNPPGDTPVLLDTAVVLGGSIAGLLAARVLSDHAATVVVIDRDDPDGDAADDGDGAPGYRARVPQRSHLHTLLPGGLRQLERWFPGFTDQALAAGARSAPAAGRRVYVGGARRPRSTGTAMLTSTRPFLEEQIRRHTLALPNVKMVGDRATGLEFSRGAVTGVRYESGGEPGVQPSDFTVDAMGRSSRLSQWLALAGLECPRPRRMKVEINYATALLREMEGDPDAGIIRWQNPSSAADLKGAVLIQVEDARWQVTMSGYADRRPGRTPGELVMLANSGLPAEFAAVVERDRIIGEIAAYRHAESIRRDFRAVRRFPARLAAVGDSAASFNPVYEQGIASAALQASALSEFLRGRPDLTAPARDFFALQAVVVDAAWDTSTTADLALPHIDGPYPPGYRLRQRMDERIRAAALRDPVIAGCLDEIRFMLKHPRSRYRPGILTRVLLAGLRRRGAPS